VQLLNALCVLEIIKGLLKSGSTREKRTLGFPMELHYNHGQFVLMDIIFLPVSGSIYKCKPAVF